MIDKPGWLIELITKTKSGERSEFFDVAIRDHRLAAALVWLKHAGRGDDAAVTSVEPLLMGYVAALGLRQGQYRRYEDPLEHHQANLD